ncbi:hypothetical protein A4X13_0g6266 [Tilletia indica]|uniref:Uncharacterized protein n=1 Tax=Tilletia indica TaxID=43049 RepID=A0A177TD96_9BASI|nr:hypothetical protein A4X13_0g6266 [Tilletia indica]
MSEVMNEPMSAPRWCAFVYIYEPVQRDIKINTMKLSIIGLAAIMFVMASGVKGDISCSDCISREFIIEESNGEIGCWGSTGYDGDMCASCKHRCCHDSLDFSDCCTGDVQQC